MVGPAKINIFGVDVDDISVNRAVDEILKLATDKKGHHMVVTVNTEFVMMARRNPEFAKILKKADLALPDGWWVAFSKLIFGGKEQDRITGVDLVEKLAKISAKKAVRIGFLGGFSSVARIVSERQKIANPGLNVVFAGPGDPTISRELRLKSGVLPENRVDILFVAYGMGRQEFFIEKYQKKLNVGVFIGVGGAFDYLAGVRKRAPKIMQDFGLEWFWRLVTDPVRIWRMRVLPAFLVLIFGKILFRKSNL